MSTVDFTTEPERVEDTNRTLYLRWIVTRDDDGVGTAKQLAIFHYSGRGFVASLNDIELKGPTEWGCWPMNAKTIHTGPKQRYSPKAREAFVTEAIAVLRERFPTTTEEVTA